MYTESPPSPLRFHVKSKIELVANYRHILPQILNVFVYPSSPPLLKQRFGSPSGKGRNPVDGNAFHFCNMQERLYTLTDVFVQLQVTFLQLNHIAIISAIDRAVDVGAVAGKGRSNTIVHQWTPPPPCNFPELRVEPPDLPPRLLLYLKRPDVNLLGLHCGLLPPENSRHGTLKLHLD